MVVKMNKSIDIEIKDLREILKECGYSNERIMKYLMEDDSILQKRLVFELETHGIIKKECKIINIGAGRGGLTCYLLKKGYNVDSLEPNPCYAKIIKYKLNKYGFNRSKIFLTKIEDFNKKEAYDVALLVDVIEHVFDPETTLKNVYSLLKKNGKVYITVPNRFQLIDPHYKLPFICFMPLKFADIILKLLGKEKKEKKAGLQKLSEMHYYTYGKFKRLCNKIGFEVIDLRKKEVFFPEKYIHPSQKKYLKIMRMFKKLKLSWIAFILIRSFFGHKLLLIKK